ncbi:hypothetical protein ACMFMG_010169 [Clarireedia jacksonii]
MSDSSVRRNTRKKFVMNRSLAIRAHCGDGKDEIPANMLRFSAFAKKKKRTKKVLDLMFKVGRRRRSKLSFGTPGKHWMMASKQKENFPNTPFERPLLCLLRAESRALSLSLCLLKSRV